MSVLVSQLPKGTRVRLANGWEAVLLDDDTTKDPNIRTAEVYGAFTETGSIYVSTIAEALLDDKWVTVALDASQRAFSDVVHDFLRPRPNGRR